MMQFDNMTERAVNKQFFDMIISWVGEYGPGAGVGLKPDEIKCEGVIKITGGNSSKAIKGMSKLIDLIRNLQPDHIDARVAINAKVNLLDVFGNSKTLARVADGQADFDGAYPVVTGRLVEDRKLHEAAYIRIKSDQVTRVLIGLTEQISINGVPGAGLAVNSVTFVIEVSQ